MQVCYGTPKEISAIVKFYFQNQSMVTLTQRGYRNKYRARQMLPKTIRPLVNKFSETGSELTSKLKHVSIEIVSIRTLDIIAVLISSVCVHAPFPGNFEGEVECFLYRMVSWIFGVM